MFDTTEYDALTFEDRDEVDAQNHEAALAILIDGNEW